MHNDSTVFEFATPDIAPVEQGRPPEVLAEVDSRDIVAATAAAVEEMRQRALGAGDGIAA